MKTKLEATHAKKTSLNGATRNGGLLEGNIRNEN